MSSYYFLRSFTGAKHQRVWSEGMIHAICCEWGKTAETLTMRVSHLMERVQKDAVVTEMVWGSNWILYWNYVNSTSLMPLWLIINLQLENGCLLDWLSRSTTIIQYYYIFFKGQKFCTIKAVWMPSSLSKNLLEHFKHWIDF